MRLRLTLLLAACIAGSCAASAGAQHAEYVMFGEPNDMALTLSPERQAVHPLTAPFFHEDSFITSDVRAWAIYHDFPTVSAIGGGTAKAVAAQVRLALTDELQLVAYKDGYLDMNTGAVDDDGFFDVAAGIKWNPIHDWENDFHVAFGAGYELSIGDDDVLQDDDEWRLWASVNKGFDRLHLGANVNVFFADDKSDGLGNSDRLSWHLHADYYLCESFSPVLEINGYHTLDEGGVVLPFQGVDVANLGGGKSEDVITAGLGGEFRLDEDWAFRLAYETPLSDADDLFGYRWTGSVVFSF